MVVVDVDDAQPLVTGGGDQGAKVAEHPPHGGREWPSILVLVGVEHVNDDQPSGHGQALRGTDRGHAPRLMRGVAGLTRGSFYAALARSLRPT
jgi:hypothetical protein